MDDDWHVMPVDDLVAHERSEDCVCGPTMERESGRTIWVHEALDGRD